MGSCLGCMYSCCCCECNFIIFPAPHSSYSSDSLIKTFQNSKGHQVPYLQITTGKSSMNIIYFHGNAEDIGYSISFLTPFQDYFNANIYAIQYPTYGTYNIGFPARISNGIKSDSLQFFDYLQKNKPNRITNSNTLIIGRSIGSGGATYLAARRNFQQLVLISPFSSIPRVAQDIVGCPGRYILKNHFDNLQQIKEYRGRLLIIHGKVDEVINCRHGQLVKQEYEKKNQQFSAGSQVYKCEYNNPLNMSHNYFDFENDILRPIQKFVGGMNIQQKY